MVGTLVGPTPGSQPALAGPEICPSKAATAGTPSGPERDAARTFYTAAVAQLRAFKETRNQIMHMRGDFDELDAIRAINRVRDFMNGLSAKIGEKTRRPIGKWP